MKTYVHKILSRDPLGQGIVGVRDCRGQGIVGSGVVGVRGYRGQGLEG